ncbi:MAG: hypothetical protein CMJ38_08640 [Phycisphaerae bacterium]|nr:hypothetical protein [Phycisphaerae bacterium]
MNLILLLAVLAGLLLVFGLVAIFVIVAVSRRSRAKIMAPKQQTGLKVNEPNAWEEAGKRISEQE